MISVFGSTGFIGTSFCNLYKNEVVTIPRNKRAPLSTDILYLISTTNNYHVFSDPFLDIGTNLTTLIEVLEKCRGKDIIFNFVSSWFVYGDTDLPAKENSYCNPKGFYSITKRAAEQLLISYCKTFNIKYRILRLSNVYGSSDKFSKKRNALQYLMDQLKQSKDIELYYNGDFVRDYLHVHDVSRAIKLCIQKGKVNEIYNIGSGQPITFIDLITYMKDKFDSCSEIESIDPPEFHNIVQVKDMYLDTSKLVDLGFKPDYTIWEGLNSIYG